MDDPLMTELMIVTDIVEAYEAEHCQLKLFNFSHKFSRGENL